MSGKVEMNEETQQYLEAIGHLDIVRKESECLSEKNSKLLENVSSDKNTNAMCSIEFWKHLGIEKDQATRGYEWVNPKPISKEELDNLNYLRTQIKKKDTLEGDKARFLKQLRKINLEKCITRMNINKSLEKQHREIKEKKTTILSNNLEKCPIDFNDQMDKVLEFEERNPNTLDEVEEGQLINNLHIPLEDYSEAQLINTTSRTTRYGRDAVRERSNTYLGDALSMTKVLNFGSIGDFDIDSIPTSLVKCKGTVITYVSSDKHSHRQKQMVSRRFISRLMSYWSYIVNLDSNTSRGNYQLALEVWSIPINTKGKSNKDILMVNGEMAISMIRDLIFLFRNRPLKSSDVSQQLYNVVRERQFRSKKDFSSIISEMKERLYITRTLGDKVWAYSRIQPEYLEHLLKELVSGDYDTEILVPSILDLYKYPLECKDTHLVPMTDEQHKKNLDDYDIGQHIFERD